MKDGIMSVINYDEMKKHSEEYSRIRRRVNDSLDTEFIRQMALKYLKQCEEWHQKATGLYMYSFDFMDGIESAANKTPADEMTDKDISVLRFVCQYKDRINRLYNKDIEEFMREEIMRIMSNPEEREKYMNYVRNGGV
jgi:hypothetical protein